MAGFAGNWSSGVYEGPNAVKVAATLGVRKADVDVYEGFGGFGSFTAPVADPEVAQQKAEAAAKRQVGRQMSLEETAGLKISTIGERVVVSWQGKSYGYRSGELRVRTSTGAMVNRDLGSVAEHIYGSASAGSVTRLERYIEGQISGGARARRKATLKQFGRAKAA